MVGFRLYYTRLRRLGGSVALCPYNKNTATGFTYNNVKLCVKIWLLPS